MIDNQPSASILEPPSQDDKTLAAVTHASGVLAGFIMPLIVYLVSKETKPWLTAEAKEALNFQITVLIAFVVCTLLTIVIIGPFLAAAVWVTDVVFCIMAAVKAANGEPYNYPVTLRLIK